MAHSIFKKSKIPVDPKLCFTLMPFSKEFNDLYQDQLKPLIESLSLTCLRADEVFSTGAIIEDIWENINKARFLVADVTGRNPNVFYELGIAHAIDKEVIIITQKIDDVPFDTKHIRHIVYEFTPRGVKKLEEVLKYTINNILP